MDKLSGGRLLVIATAVACAVVALGGAALSRAGVEFAALLAGRQSPTTAASVLLLGLLLGLRHAVEADHLAAVTAIVSERKSVLSASLVGGLWGVGHTLSLLAAGAAVILLRVEIGRRTELALEFCVALMLVALGANAIRKLLRGGRVHLHAHRHGGRWHAHPHLHEGAAGATHDAAAVEETHHGLRLGGRPLVVGMPVHFTARRFARANLAIRCLAGLLSLGCGLFMVYEIGFVDGLFP